MNPVEERKYPICPYCGRVITWREAIERQYPPEPSVTRCGVCRREWT